MAIHADIYELQGDDCPRCEAPLLTDILSGVKKCSYNYGCGYDSSEEAVQQKLF